VVNAPPGASNRARTTPVQSRPELFPQTAPLRCQHGQKPKTKASTSQTPRSIVSVRPERGYSAKIYDRSTVSSPKSLPYQFGRKYAQKKVGNTEFNAIEPVWHYVRMHATHNRYHASEQEFVRVLDGTLSAIVENPRQIEGYLNPFL